MARYNRKTTPKVKGGKVQRKNRAELTPNYHDTPMPHLIIDKERPGAGYKHLVTKQDIRTFIGILPEWDKLSEGLNAIVLDAGGQGADGWHHDGVVAVCAWDRGYALDGASPKYVKEHEDMLGKLRVPYRRNGKLYRLEFDLLTARAFLLVHVLVHVLVHELGHHHDRITTRSQRNAARGETYAETYARKHEDAILQAYCGTFEL